MLLTNDYIYPTELTGYVRAALADRQLNRFVLSAFLPNHVIDDFEYRTLAGGTGLTETATFRTWDAESSIGSTQPIKYLRGELPPISRKIRMSEFDRLRTRKIGNQQVLDQIYNDADRLVDEIAARIEVARGEALSTGKVKIDDENGLSGFEIDYGRASGHTVAASTKWDADSGDPDPLADLMSWRDTYVDSNGEEPGTIMCSYKVLNLMLKNDAIRNQIFPGSTNQPNIVTRNELDAVLGSQGLPPITVNRSRVKVAGTAKYVVPEDTVLLLPAPVGPEDFRGTQLGSTEWGTTAESLEPGYGLEGTADAPGIVGGFYRTDDPVARWTKAAAIALPVMANPDLSFAATVLS